MGAFSLVSTIGVNESEQDAARQLLMKELSEDFSVDEIEAHKDQIKFYIRLLLEHGEFDERETLPQNKWKELL